MKKILIINGNPDKNSLSFELATAYKKGADASGAACTLVHLIPHAGAGLRPVPFNLINNQNIYHPIFSSVIVSTTIHVVFGFKY